MSPLTQSLILLGATALVSGLLAPFIVNRIQVSNQQRLKIHEAALTRQSKIIEEQGAFIHRLSNLLWEFQLTLIAPLYYGQAAFQGVTWHVPAADTDESSSNTPESRLSPYEDAAKKYMQNADRLLGSIRAEIGGAVRLVPPDKWAALKDLYYRELLPLDVAVTQLIGDGPTEADAREWSEKHTYILEDLAAILDETVDDLAESLNLKYRGT
jgi:hypothetical protein